MSVTDLSKASLKGVREQRQKNSHGDKFQFKIGQISHKGANQLSREISRLGQEFNPAVYKQKIKQEMHKQMENRTIPSIVEEEVQHHQKVNKVEEAYQHTLDEMNGYVTNKKRLGLESKEQFNESKTE